MCALWLYGRCVVRPEAKHQYFKRLTPTIYWPKVLVQFTEKHNMRIAWEVHEGLHCNQLVDVIDGTQMEHQTIEPGSSLHASISTLSAGPQDTGMQCNLFNDMSCILKAGDAGTPLQLCFFHRIHHGGKDYVTGMTYVITESAEEDARVGLMHNMFVCLTTNELYFSVRFHASGIKRLQGHMPCVDSSTLRDHVDIVAYHKVNCIEAAVLHRRPELDISLVVKY